jgi:subtilisin-like proprotein convertase family protein
MTQRLVTAFIFCLCLCFDSFAGTVYIYGGQFDLPIPAPDEPESEYGKGRMEDAVINVPDHIVIDDLDVRIDLKHTKAFDLQIYLQSPSGKKICLNSYDALTEYFEGQDYIQTVFDDEADVPIEQGKPPFTGRFKPKAPDTLGVFDGEDTFGPWRLQIYDAYYADSGHLNSFELMITVPEPATAILLILGASLARIFHGRIEFRTFR